jgi:hypothetical protein
LPFQNQVILEGCTTQCRRMETVPRTPKATLVRAPATVLNGARDERLLSLRWG